MGKKLTVFMGGTCGDSKWRDDLIKKLGENVDAFNPVVENWTPACQAEEDKHKKEDDVNLFCITPATNSPYSLFEIGTAMGEDKDRLVVCFLDKDDDHEIEPHMAKAVKKMIKDLKQRNVPCFTSIDELANALNEAAQAKCPLTQKSEE